ncbi:uncharacterized protein C2845_PM12G16100 [Panicum miliaceum]|uniref:Uncharacterized protein n=1 Tax=Panicum miliaceum TaxID=4540 RepID=A0A3L6QF07_PANMI|nr:uncharacterized protein C2845_PM12G16100 [Panicum miliaceum]
MLAMLAAGSIAGARHVSRDASAVQKKEGKSYRQGKAKPFFQRGDLHLPYPPVFLARDVPAVWVVGGVVGRARQAGRGEAGPPAAARQQQRSGSSGHGGYRAGHVQAALDPPSPRVATCGICGIFGNHKQLPPARGAGRLTQQRSRTSPPKHQLQGTASVDDVLVSFSDKMSSLLNLFLEDESDGSDDELEMAAVLIAEMEEGEQKAAKAWRFCARA